MSYDIEFRQNTTVRAGIKLVNGDGSLQTVTALASVTLLAEHSPSGTKQRKVLTIRGPENDVLFELSTSESKGYTAGEWQFEVEGVMAGSGERSSGRAPISLAVG